MGVPIERAAQPATDVEATVRLRMMGIHVAHAIRGRRASSGARPTRAALHCLLAELGLLRGDIVRVHWYTARRPVARVDFASANPVILKWLEDTELETDNEGWALALLGRMRPPAGLRGALPHLLCTSADGRVQAFEYIPDTVTWAERVAHAPAGTDQLFALLGDRLAELHRLPVREEAVAHRDRHVRFPIPPLARLTPGEYARGYGTDFAEYMTLMQAVDPYLTELRESWAPSAYIHFDIRDDNVLFAADQTKVSIVDWELAGFGDPCYDVGAAVGQTLSHGIPARAGALAAVHRFLAAYQDAAGASDPTILRALQFAGVFLLLTSLGRLEKVGSLGRVGHLSLLIGRRLVSQPEACHAAVRSQRGRT